MRRTPVLARTERGVWIASYLRDGQAVAIAVDSQGRKLAVVVLHPPLSATSVKRILSRLLDAVDPLPAPIQPTPSRPMLVKDATRRER